MALLLATVSASLKQLTKCERKDLEVHWQLNKRVALCQIVRLCGVNSGQGSLWLVGQMCRPGYAR